MLTTSAAVVLARAAESESSSELESVGVDHFVWGVILLLIILLLLVFYIILLFMTRYLWLCPSRSGAGAGVGVDIFRPESELGSESLKIRRLRSPGISTKTARDKQRNSVF